MTESEKEAELSTVKILCKEGRETVDKQVEWMQQIDQKAIHFLRANIMFLGLLLTALSLLVQSDTFEIAPYMNIFTGLGIMALLSSIGFAAITYISSRFEGGVDCIDIDESVEEAYETEQLYQRLAVGYSEWIEYNGLVIKINAYLSTVTILLTIDAIALLTIGILVGALGYDGGPISASFILVLSATFVFLNWCILKMDDVVQIYYKAR